LSEVGLLLDKAARAFRSAELQLENGDADFAASRAYYGSFYVAEALLLTEGLQLSRHGQVVAQYGRLFARPLASIRVFTVSSIGVSASANPRIISLMPRSIP
jgi:uncharacterized protein (UPF0332 family)